MAKIFISADWHFYHQNIIKYCGRPFNSIEIMNEILIENANSVVGENDIVYHVGDFSFHKPWSDIIKQLNGTWVFLRGNHDFKRLNNIPLPRALEIRRGGKRIYLNHHPAECENISGFDMYLTGHAHEKWKVKILPDKKLINVGVDVWGFKPILLDNLIKEYGNG